MNAAATVIVKCHANTPVIVHNKLSSYSQHKYTTAVIDISSLQIRPEYLPLSDACIINTLAIPRCTIVPQYLRTLMSRPLNNFCAELFFNSHSL